jgi:FMN-dependent NADH-azoreductase
VQSADILVIGVPVYNFGVPAALKAWIDMIARARETFKYTENGSVGLLSGKKAYLIVASGGTEVESGIDYATPYMKHVLGFIGVTDVTVIAAGQQMMDEKASEKAEKSIEALAA